MARFRKRYFGDAKIDSKWEKELSEGVLKSATFKPPKFGYTIEKTYSPDFLIEIDHKRVYIEAKGRMRDNDEARKYIFIREALCENSELVFLFYDPNKPMPFAKKRKDGTKFTHSNWADKHGFKWYTVDTFPKEWTDASHN